MPRPTDSTSSYLPGLDGIRAIAVAAVIIFHLNADLLPGGLLGVGVFFTLSGFLITAVLLRAWERHQRRTMGFKTFYLRRARRLIPAVVVVLIVVLGATLVTAPGEFGGRFLQSLAATFYVANWHTIFSGQSYFDRFTLGPLDHLWSLSVEEQFYLVWPVVLLGLLAVTKGRARLVSYITAGLALVSFVLMWLLAVPGFDQTRVYEGTDTRAGGLLVGAVVALWWHGRRTDNLEQRRLRTLDIAAAVGLVGIVVLCFTTDQYSMFLYRGGILLLSVATVAVVLAASINSTVTAKVLGIAPLRWIGERSYGIYLWHLPIIAFAPDEWLPDLPWARPVALVGLTLVFSAMSWTFVEDPIRKHGLIAYFKTDSEARQVHGRGQAWIAGLVTLAIMSTASMSAMALTSGKTGDTASEQTEGMDNQPPIPTDVHDADDDDVATPSATPSAKPSAGASASAKAGPSASPSPTPSAPALKTSCEQVVHVGDSTSLGLIQEAYLPKAKDRIPAQYKAAGVKKVYTDILGARSIVERYKGQPNAQEAVASKLSSGYNGCWVIAMGNNEAANQNTGGVYPFDKRIDLIMEPIGDMPVLWPTSRNLRTSGPYKNSTVLEWDKALLEACKRYPNLRVYDWADEVKDPWFGSDRIHFTSKGWRERSHRIAQALAVAFPKDGSPSSSCVVGSKP